MKKVFALVGVVSLLSGPASAANPTSITEAVQFIEADTQLIAHWISNELKTAIPFNSTSGNVVPSQLKIFGISVGVSANVSATKMDNDALHALGTNIVDTNEIDTFSRLPVPLVLAHAKVGLPFGFDAGVRFGGIPSTDTDEGDTQMSVENTVVGLDVRKKLIEEGITRPFGLTVGINYTHADGEISATSPYTAETGSNVTLTNAVGTARSAWKTDSLGAQAILNKKILFINPYLGASVNKNFGDVETTITNAGTLTYVPSSTSQTLTTRVVSTEDADGVDLRGLVGIDFTFLPFMKLGIQGEFANQGKLAAGIGLRVQFR